MTTFTSYLFGESVDINYYYHYEHDAAHGVPKTFVLDHWEVTWRNPATGKDETLDIPDFMDKFVIADIEEHAGVA